jgi:hypothetical protein
VHWFRSFIKQQKLGIQRLAEKGPLNGYLASINREEERSFSEVMQCTGWKFLWSIMENGLQVKSKFSFLS